MNFKKISVKKQIILVLLIAALIANAIFLVYGLVYAGGTSVYKKDVLLIGILFLLIGRSTIYFYKSGMNNHSA
ncbi:MAG: hypothetical protein ABI091_25450 [Ferruginibacter sp.]